MNSFKAVNLKGYPRNDGRKGIRNVVVIAYLVECAHHVASRIQAGFGDQAVHLIGFGGCYPNVYADKMMSALCTHPNVGAVLLVSLGCESFNRKRLLQNISSTGRPVKLVGIQETGGTKNAIREGRAFVDWALQELKDQQPVPVSISELSVGVVCGGSDATSGITSNPAVGIAFDLLVKNGAIAMFENTGEMVGLETMMSERGITAELKAALKKSVEKAAAYYTVMGHGSFAPGNAEGGLSTLEEKAMGAYFKTGSSPISGLIKPADIPSHGGLYLMDIVPDGEPRFGFPNPNDTSEIIELIASGAHCVLFTTGRGSVVGAAISPVIKVCANPETYARMEDDMDVNAGRILRGEETIEGVGQEIFERIIAIGAGERSCSEELGHQEFVLGYKTFDPVGPSCQP
jgi:altronate hydrolase